MALVSLPCRRAPPCPALPCLPCSPFKRSWSGEVGAAAQWTGEVLELRERGAAAQQAFLQGHMVPALDSLLAGEEWRRWDEDLGRIWYDPGQLQELLALHAVWRVEKQAQQEARREERLQKEAAAAAAAHAAPELQEAGP
jgi:hypothetical protein